MAQPRVSEAERNRRAYWAQRRARERTEAAQATNDPRHPHNHRCTERTIEYGTDEHTCTVCGRVWRLEEFTFGPAGATQVGSRYRAIPLTRTMPPYRKEYDHQ